MARLPGRKGEKFPRVLSAVLLLFIQHNKRWFIDIAVNNFISLRYLSKKFGPGAIEHASIN